MSTHIIKSLDKMNVYDSHKLFYILSSDTYDISKYFIEHPTHKGGGKGEEVKFEYKGAKFLFFKTTHKNSREFHLYPENNEERHDYCIFIIVDLLEKFIRLDTIAYNEKCFDKIQEELLGKEKCNGSFLLKLALKFIQTINENYNMKYVTLKDNAFKDCNGAKISVSQMSILLTGDTWYGKYGFYPKDGLDLKEDKRLKKLYKKNKKIIEKTL